MKFKEWLKTWLDLYVRPVVKAQTYIKYDSVVRLHIIPALGGYSFKELRPEILQRFVVNMSEKYAPNTVNCMISILQKSLRMAVSLGISPVQFADKIIRPKIKGKKISCFTVEEQHKIENEVYACKNPKYFGIIISLYTGLRIGELLSLQWNDIDFKNGFLYVNRSCYFGKVNGVYAIITDTPKTVQSVRTIPIPKQLMPRLKLLKRKSDCEYVVSYKGQPVKIRSYQKSFEVMLNRLGIQHKGFHSLRHTFATRAIECGMDVKTLSELLGHKNAEVTLNRYAHSLMEHKCEMMNKLGRFMQ